MICPTELALRQFLDDQAGTDGPVIESHLEWCERCRLSAERLALDPTVLPPPPSGIDTLPVPPHRV